MDVLRGEGGGGGGGRSLSWVKPLLNIRNSRGAKAFSPPTP